MRVAIQGIKGSYSEEAANKLVGAEADLIELENFADVFKALDAGRADYAVVPVENRIIGDIAVVADRLGKKNYKLVESTVIDIDHVLVGTADSSPEQIASVRSHPAAIAQCEKYLTARAGLRTEPYNDTASSIRSVVEENDRSIAAIGSGRAAALYGAKILRENIADQKGNWTKFYMVAI